MLEEYWNQQHIDKNVKMLTGSSLHSYCSFFNLIPEALEGQTILEIGVGLGKATRELAAIAKDLRVLDISHIAIDNVSDVIEMGYTDALDLPFGLFDIAISHLVAQHMSDSDLIIQMESIIESLKYSGKFYMQFADALGEVKGTEEELQQGGGVLRSPEKMKQLVSYANANMKLIATRKINNNVTWYGAEMRKK